MLDSDSDTGSWDDDFESDSWDNDCNVDSDIFGDPNDDWEPRERDWDHSASEEYGDPGVRTDDNDWS